MFPLDVFFLGVRSILIREVYVFTIYFFVKVYFQDFL